MVSDIQPAAADDAEAAHQLPITFEAFHDLHAQGYVDYAYAHLADATLALDLVHDVFVALAERWAHVLSQPNPAAYAWALLRHTVEVESARRGEHLALIEKTAFAYALVDSARLLLQDLDAAEDLEVGISLAHAIQDLPGRQHDAIVLRYLFGYRCDQISEAMGIEAATVRSLISQARTRIEARLAPRRMLGAGPMPSLDEE